MSSLFQDFTRILRVFWLEWLSTAIVAAGILVLRELGTPFCRAFDPNDPDINYPYKSETFPSWTLFPLGIAIPIVLYFVIAFSPGGYRLAEFHQSTLMLAQSFVMAFIVEVSVKLYAGRLRPNFMAAVRLSGVAYNASASFIDICDTTAHIGDINDERVSFPSGHASTMFSTMVPVTLLLVARLKCFNLARTATAFPQLLLASLPIALATVVAVTRTRDNRHHFSDILAGALLGIITARVAFQMNYSVLPKQEVTAPPGPPSRLGQGKDDTPATRAASATSATALMLAERIVVPKYMLLQAATGRTNTGSLFEPMLEL